MSLTCVGSVAFDAVATPFGERERMLGGSATHFSLAASFFTSVRVVGVVGDDFGDEELRVFDDHGIDVTDLERVSGRTFFWRGRYDYDLNTAQIFQGIAGKAEVGLPKYSVTNLTVGRTIT